MIEAEVFKSFFSAIGTSSSLSKIHILMSGIYIDVRNLYKI